MTQPASDIEPELLLQPPRNLKHRLRGRFFRWLFITLAIIAPGVLSYFGWVCQQNWNALHDHGAKVTGHVVERVPPVPGKDGHGPRVAYEYPVDGKMHRLYEGLTEEVYEQIKVGDEKTIVYLPEEPDEAASVDELAKEGNTATSAVALWIVAGLLALIGFPCWWWYEHVQSRWRRLMREGTPVRTTSVSVGSSSNYDMNTNSSTTYWIAYYEFSIDGQARKGKVTVDRDVAQNLQEPGVQATVLYDPLNPRVFQLYPAIAKIYQIERPTSDRFEIQ